MSPTEAPTVKVSGTANLAAMVLPMTKIPILSAQQFTILSPRAATNNGITVRDTAIIDYELPFPNPNDMVLAVTALSRRGAALIERE
jgi:hypothetical protein